MLTPLSGNDDYCRIDVLYRKKKKGIKIVLVEDQRKDDSIN